MALTFRAASTQGNASGGALTVTKPTGTVDGDIIVVWAYLESDTNTWSSGGSGFTSLGTGANTGSFVTEVWIKKASSEPASWTWTPTTSNWRTVIAITYSGQTGSGTTYHDVLGTIQQIDADTSPDAPSLTTTVANETILALHGNFQGSAANSATGAATTERADYGGVVIYEGTVVSAGASGVTTFSVGTVDHVSRHLALLNDSGGGAAAGGLPVRYRRRIQRFLEHGSRSEQRRRA